MGIGSVGSSATQGAVSAVEGGASHGAAMMRKAKQVEKIEAESAMKLIDAAGPPKNSGGGRVDTYA